MKAERVRITTPYPTLLRMAKTLGASKSEVKDAQRLVRKIVARRNALLRAKRAAAAP